MINVDANPAYPKDFTELEKENKFLNTVLRTKKYLNNLIEQDHRRVKWKTKDSFGYQSYKTATLSKFKRWKYLSTFTSKRMYVYELTFFWKRY